MCQQGSLLGWPTCIHGRFLVSPKAADATTASCHLVVVRDLLLSSPREWETLPPTHRRRCLLWRHGDAEIKDSGTPFQIIGRPACKDPMVISGDHGSSATSADGDDGGQLLMCLLLEISFFCRYQTSFHGTRLAVRRV